MRVNLSAWTAPDRDVGAPLVRFVSINQERTDEVLICVRQGDGVMAEIGMPTAAFRSLARDAYAATGDHDP